MHNFLTLHSLLRFGSNHLKSNDISNYRQESTWLLLHAIGQNSSWLVSHRDDEPSPTDIHTYLESIYKRSDHIPLQLIIGKATFYGRDFCIYPDVFIPRQDTETIIDVCKKKILIQPLTYAQARAVLALASHLKTH